MDKTRVESQILGSLLVSKNRASSAPGNTSKVSAGIGKGPPGTSSAPSFAMRVGMFMNSWLLALRTDLLLLAVTP